MRWIPVNTDAVPVPLLELAGLGVTFETPNGTVTAVEAVNLAVGAGECLGIVGESGAGKTQLFLAVTGLLEANGRSRGSARFRGQELLGRSAAELDRVRGALIGMVFQDPMSALTPHLCVGDQIAEVRVRHLGESWGAARASARRLLERVHVADAARRMHQFPYELSGGMRQRVMIALALAAGPQLLIADEPTTALDVTIQAQILALLLELKRSAELALVLITHDLGAVAGLADRVAVMRHGRIIETATVARILKEPRDPYTLTLLPSASAFSAAAAGTAPAAAAAAALTVSHLTVDFPIARGPFARPLRLRAVNDVTLELAAGESLALVGESGCGKSTLVRAVLQLLAPVSGRVAWLGRELGTLPKEELRALRPQLQIIFQDPLASLDERQRVDEIVGEGLRVHARKLTAAARGAAVRSALERVGLEAALGERYPHELSGGQCQRVAIARAMILAPQLLVCDEPLSALDIPTQQQIVALLAQLKREAGLCLLFVSHNLAVVQQLCERVLVMYLGHTMELAPAPLMYATPRHPYTQELMNALPLADPQLQPARLARVRDGEPPSALAPPSGCVYRSRCAHALAVCAAHTPPWEEVSGGHRIACHRWRELPEWKPEIPPPRE